ncbi:MAG: phosphatidylinositol-specific phospholipase C domain-containing protein [Clostridiales bacterium]|nr:phosphatidylinositol-specific phospholipase C domain-containing protein [Clostridiales bacterium]
MTGKRKLTLICVSVALVLILCAVGILALVANSQNDKTQPREELSRWMGMIKDETLLKSVVIPGAHDAGTMGLSYLAETQDRDTADMLECGIRYLDLRVSKDKDGDLKIYHGPFKGVMLASVVLQIKEFLKNNPSEALILDFQHFDGDAEHDTQIMVRANLPVVKAAGDFVEFVDNLTLGDARGKCLVLWGADSADGEIFLRRNNDEGTLENTALQSYYEGSRNKKRSSVYIKDSLPYYIERYKQNGKGLFVLQGQLTDGLFVFGPHFREATHNKNMNAYVNDLYDSADLSLINIIMRDYVSPYKNCLALQLNVPKDNVKTEYLDEFRTMLAETLNFVRAQDLY